MGIDVTPNFMKHKPTKEELKRRAEIKEWFELRIRKNTPKRPISKTMTIQLEKMNNEQTIIFMENGFGIAVDKADISKWLKAEKDKAYENH